MIKKIALGADHRGFKLKESLKKTLSNWGIPFVDFGTHFPESTDYPKIGEKVALAVKQGQCYRGILICGSGIGFCIVANKIKGIRAALCHNLKSARLSRLHNDANVLVLDENISNQLAKRMLKVWLESNCEEGRHRRRLNQIKTIEKKHFK